MEKVRSAAESQAERAATRRSPAGPRATVPIFRQLLGPIDVLALQRSAGNRAVSRLIATRTTLPSVPAMGLLRTPDTIQRKRRNRRGGGKNGTSSTSTSSPGGSGSTAVMVVPTPKTVKLTIKEKDVEATPELVPVSETVGTLAGGVLDVWEGLETATDTNKSVVSRGGGLSKATGGGTAVGSTVAKSLGSISDSTGEMTATVTEACGLISTAAECYEAVKEAYSKGAMDVLTEIGKSLLLLTTSVLKTAEAYAKWAKESETFKKWIGENLVPAVGIVSGAAKIILKVKELWELSTKRKALVAKVARYRDQKIKSGTQHLIGMIDSKWYKGAIEVISTGADVAGEAMKWADWTVGYLTGSVVSAGSKLLPLGAKIFSYLWQTANDWGGTSLWGGKTTLQLESDTDNLADMIVSKRNDAFGKLLCETIGIEPSAAGDKREVLKALAELA